MKESLAIQASNVINEVMVKGDYTLVSEATQINGKCAYAALGKDAAESYGIDVDTILAIVVINLDTKACYILPTDSYSFAGPQQTEAIVKYEGLVFSAHNKVYYYWRKDRTLISPFDVAKSEDKKRYEFFFLEDTTKKVTEKETFSTIVKTIVEYIPESAIKACETREELMELMRNAARKAID